MLSKLSLWVCRQLHWKRSYVSRICKLLKGLIIYDRGFQEHRYPWKASKSEQILTMDGMFININILETLSLAAVDALSWCRACWRSHSVFPTALPWFVIRVRHFWVHQPEQNQTVRRKPCNIQQIWVCWSCFLFCHKDITPLFASITLPRHTIDDYLNAANLPRI